MTVPSIPADNGNPDPNQNPGHPAWQEILDVLPESLHGVVKPTLEKWDKGVQDKFQEIHTKYDPYKQLIEDQVPYEFVDQALQLAIALDQNPNEVVQNIVTQLELGYVPKSELESLQAQLAASSAPTPLEDDDVPTSFDITKSPEFQAMQKALENLTSQTEAQKAAEAERQATEQFNSTLTSLKNEHGDFNETFVTALMSQGIDGATAVKQYHDTVNQAAAQLAQQANPTTQQVDTPPVVMGGSGNSGSGVPSAPIRMGDLSNKDTTQLVVEMLQQQAAQNNT